MKRYGIAAALLACLLASWNCGASDSSRPSGQTNSSAVTGAASDMPASPALAVAATPASEMAASNLTSSFDRDYAAYHESRVTSAAAHAFENLSTPSQNLSFPVDGSASKGIGVPIDLGNNWTLRPWVGFGMPGVGESGYTPKLFGRAMLGMSLSCSF